MRLRDLREEAGMSLQDVGDILGVTRNAVSLWERGKTEPPHQTLIALADLFGVTVDYLLVRPGAHRDSPHVQAVKKDLREYLKLGEPSLDQCTPDERAAFVLRFLIGRAQVFELHRLAGRLLIDKESLAAILGGAPAGPGLIERITEVAEIPLTWFYLPKPRLGELETDP